MSRYIFTFFVFCCFFHFSKNARAEICPNQIIEQREELFFYFKAKTHELNYFNSFLSIDRYDGKYIYAYANPKQYEQFLKLNREFKPVEDYYLIDKNDFQMAASLSEMENWDRYPYFEVYREMMINYAENYSSLCKLDTIGFSYDGRAILMLNITGDFDNKSAPEFLYTGQMHGDELVSGFLLLRLIDYLLSNYNYDERITNLIDELNIFINPYANPDAAWYGGNHTVADSRRSNNQNIDLNRNFKDAIEFDNPDGNEYAVETLVFKELANERNFIMSANTHSGAECVNYPYDNISILPADNDWWYFVSREYANNAQENSPSDYFTDINDGVTNGYAWYSINGSRQDYMNYFHNCRELTLELSQVKKVPSNQLQNHWEYNKEALINYMEQATYGLRGSVSDSITGEPLKAKIFIENHDFFNSHVYSNPDNGKYFRLAYEGTYMVNFSADGYRTKSFDVEIRNYEKSILDVELVNLNMLPPYADFAAKNQKSLCNAVIEFVNTGEYSQDTEFLWEFGDGNSSMEKHPSHNYSKNGSYNVMLIASNHNGTDTASMDIEIELPALDFIHDFVICEQEASIDISFNVEEELHWFNEENDDSPFYIGNSFSTPIISETINYYVQAFYEGETHNIGEADNSVGGSNNDARRNHYLVFDCYTPVILKSVKVYSYSDGYRTIFLRDAYNRTIDTLSVFIEEGEQIIDLNLKLPKQDGLKLGCFGPADLFRGFSGILSSFNFPYENEHISINKSNTTYWNDEERFYSYFYDWEIKEYDCVSEKTEITVYVDEETLADFSYEYKNNGIQFINNSVAADYVFWDFGDGNTSELRNPFHSYEETGNYLVSLYAESDCGNDELSMPIYIDLFSENAKKTKFNFYPNPAEDKIILNATNYPAKLSILCTEGKIYYQKLIVNEKNEIYLNGLKPGIYILKIQGDNYVEHSKLLIIR